MPQFMPPLRRRRPSLVRRLGTAMKSGLGSATTATRRGTSNVLAPAANSSALRLATARGRIRLAQAVRPAAKPSRLGRFARSRTFRVGGTLVLAAVAALTVLGHIAGQRDLAQGRTGSDFEGRGAGGNAPSVRSGFGVHPTGRAAG